MNITPKELRRIADDQEASGREATASDYRSAADTIEELKHKRVHLSDIKIPDTGWETDASDNHNVGDWRGRDMEWILSGLWNQVHFEMKHGLDLPSPSMVAKYMDACIEAKRLTAKDEANKQHNNNSLTRSTG